ncbi:MAG: response regulator [Ruminococcaceae bacterium]|nr:response regulator [Oscillospiraceae bacterium]
MSTVYKVLIVDDEASIRSSIRGCIDWEQTGFVIAAEADNAQDALRLVDELAIDLVISDIVMPDIDGLNFTQLLKQQHPRLPCILISGFDSFEYAQRALELRVVGYLLKPIVASKLEALLASCKEILQQNEALLQERNRHQLNRITAHRTHSAQNAPDLIDGNYYLMLISSLPAVCKNSPVDWLESALKRLLAQNKIQAHSITAYDIPRYPGIYGIMLHCSALSIQSYYHLANLLAAQINNVSPDNPFQTPCYIGVAYPCSSAKSVHPAFKQAIKNLRMIPFLNADIYTETALARKTPTEFADYLASSSESIRLLMQNRKFADAKKYINLLLCNENAGHFTPSSANSLISLMSSQLSLLIALYDFSDLAQEVEALQSPVYLLNFHNISQWRNDILRIVDHIEQCFSQHNQDDLVHRVRKYLADNYASDWDLTELAALFYVNSSYLSHIFKKKTGKTISAYIEDLRIQNACTLLLTTDVSIGDIAAAVGYSDPNYFAKRFRKKVKKSPVAYRKSPDTSGNLSPDDFDDTDAE